MQGTERNAEGSCCNYEGPGIGNKLSGRTVNLCREAQLDAEGGTLKPTRRADKAAY
jgi:hypothetical protein